MADANPLGNEAGDHVSSLTKALIDVSDKGCFQDLALQERQQELSSLQAILSDTERTGEEAQLDLRSKTRQFLFLEGEMDDRQCRLKALGQHITDVYDRNAKLLPRNREEEEEARITLAGYNTYRNKMEGHRAALAHAEGQTVGQKVLEEKRDLVRTLARRKEELRADLENGSATQQAKKEANDLKREISVLRNTVAEMRDLLLKEFETQTPIKKDIEIQNRRHEAIVKRLHCQLNKAQAIDRQTSEDIHHMERQIAELRGLLKPS